MSSGTAISNVDEDAFVSLVLQSVYDAARGQGSDAEVTRSAVQDGAKGSILLDLAVGVASGAVWDLLYAAVLRFRRSPEYKPGLRIRIDDREVTIEQIEKRNGDG